MTRIEQSSVPLASDIGIGCLPPSITSLGATFNPVGALQQVWENPIAAFSYRLGDQPDLPVPFDFARAHPGTVESDLEIYQFSGSTQGPKLLRMSLIAPQPGNPVNKFLGDVGPHRGREFRVNSLSNDGLTEYQYFWNQGRYLVFLKALGYHISPDVGFQIAKLIRIPASA
jgi:hypothetical protein